MQSMSLMERHMHDANRARQSAREGLQKVKSASPSDKNDTSSDDSNPFSSPETKQD